MFKVLGLNAFHGDASAALLTNGELTLAIEEERFNRIKHWAGLPVLAAQYCLNGDQPDHIAAHVGQSLFMLFFFGKVSLARKWYL